MLDLPYYSYRADSLFMDYDFVSVGPNGSIPKVARFTIMNNSLYNFAFGDLDKKSGEITDTARSNNADMEKVLSTLAFIILDFTYNYPGAQVFIQGRSLSRTRLYQMHIGKYWDQISPHFVIMGFRNNNWEAFERQRNYEFFIGWTR